MSRVNISIGFKTPQNIFFPNENITWKIVDGDNNGTVLTSGVGTTDPTGRLIVDLERPQSPLYHFGWSCQGEQGTIRQISAMITNETVSRDVVLRSCNISRFENPGRNWLTYETRYNWAPYCKVNAAIQLNLFRVDAVGVLLLLAPASDIDDQALGLLGRVFFPGIKPDDLRKHGTPPWEGPRRPFPPPASQGPADSSGQQDAPAGPYAVLPYNARDNTTKSLAIGTTVNSRLHRLPLVPLQQFLQMWNTASRSNIALLVDETDPEKTAAPETVQLMWKCYGERKPLRYLDKAASGPELVLAEKFLNGLFSIKTGVDLVGFDYQGSKAKLEHNCILAALRSAYLRQLDRELDFNAFADDKLLILTEIMTVVEADPKWDAWLRSKMGPENPCHWTEQEGLPPSSSQPSKRQTSSPETSSTQITGQQTVIPPTQPVMGDGFQVRSLRGLRGEPGYGYFPPTSLPFVTVTSEGAIDAAATSTIIHGESQDATSFFGKGMPKSMGVFRQISDRPWRDFWEKHYAVALGRTKARLLLRYGLQGFGGNAQNFLMEMKDGVPNGRIVVRDMGDYALHDFVLWALLGPGKGVPPDPRGKGMGQQEDYVRIWKEAFGNSKSSVAPLLWFECGVLHEFYHCPDPENDASKNHALHSEYPTFTGYHRCPVSAMHTFNPFCECCDKVAPFVGHISPLWAYALPVSPQKISSYNSNLNAARWAEVFQVETEWGIAHAKAWMHYLQAALGPKFMEEVTTKINWEPVPAVDLPGNDENGRRKSMSGRVHRPDDYANKTYLGVDLTKDAGQLGVQEPAFISIRNKWEDLYTQMKTWEMYLGMQVENFLGTEEGQERIRSYANGGWREIDKNS